MKKAAAIIKDSLNAGRIFRYVLVPIAVLSLYCGSFAYLSALFLTEGINFVFTSRFASYLVSGLAVLCLITCFVFLLSKRDGLSIKRSAPTADLKYLVFLFLPLTPITQYLIFNRSILAISDFFFVILFFVLFSGIYIFAFPYLLSYVSSSRLMMCLGLAFVMTITNMAVLSQDFNWYYEGSLKIQLPYFAFIFVAAWFLSKRNVRFLFVLLLIYFLVNTGIAIYKNEKGSEGAFAASRNNPLLAIVDGRRLENPSNVYLLVYDSYVPSETMLIYGIDNSAQESFLKENGFTLYPHTYTTGYGTLESMSRTFDLSSHFYGENRIAVSGNGIVQKTFKRLGYATHGVFASDYFLRGTGSSYSMVTPKSIVPSHLLIISGVMIGEFRFDLGFEQQTQMAFANKKHDLFKGLSASRNFLYMHSDYPNHSQNSGACLPDETELFNERLAVANDEMRQDVTLITERDPGAIVIVAGDHGPSLTKNCWHTSNENAYDISEISREDIQDRFGTFLAIKWPEGGNAASHDITVLQDVFPLVFSYLYDDPKFLSLKVAPEIRDTFAISGASVKNGTIIGGMDDGEPLFIAED